MTVVRVKGIKQFRHKRSGILYTYHRASNVRIYAEPGTPEFFAELDRAERKWKAQKPADGSLGKLIDEYRKTPEFLRLKPRTKADYEKVFDYIKHLRPMPLGNLTTGFVTRLRNKAFADRKRRFANYVVQVLSRVCTIGIGLELIKSNPAHKIPDIRKGTDERSLNRPWTVEERDAVQSAAPPHLAAPIAIGRYLGVRLSDMVRMRREDYQGGRISFITGKSGTEVTVPCPPPVAEAIAALPAHKGERLFVNSRGQAWTDAGFSSSFRKHVIALVEQGRVGKGLTFHGLRHSVATDLREEGYNPRQIADILGQKTEAMVSVYSARADMRKSNARIMDERFPVNKIVNTPDEEGGDDA